MFARVVCAFDADTYRQSMAPLRFPTSGARHGFSVLPTTYWLDSSVESGRESTRPPPVALAFAATSTSNSERTHSDASGRPCRASGCGASAATPAIVRSQKLLSLKINILRGACPDVKTER